MPSGLAVTAVRTPCPSCCRPCLILQGGWRRLARRLVLAALAAVELEPPPDRPADGLVPGAERVQYYWEAGTVLTPVLALLEPAAVRLRPRERA